MQNQFERELLKTLKSIDGTLKRIEKSMNYDEKNHLTICNAVMHAQRGNNYFPYFRDTMYDWRK